MDLQRLDLNQRQLDLNQKQLERQIQALLKKVDNQVDFMNDLAHRIKSSESDIEDLQETDMDAIESSIESLEADRLNVKVVNSRLAALEILALDHAEKLKAIPSNPSSDASIRIV